MAFENPLHDANVFILKISADSRSAVHIYFAVKARLPAKLIS